MKILNHVERNITAMQAIRRQLHANAALPIDLVVKFLNAGCRLIDEKRILGEDPQRLFRNLRVQLQLIAEGDRVARETPLEDLETSGSASRASWGPGLMWQPSLD